ncbi:hypothetical protein T484DRAFT_1565913, partial [Baffinella frigidus]
CVGCEAGTYKPERGLGSCTPCGEGNYSTSIAAVAATTCLSCPANSTSDAGSGSMAACGSCVAGTYQIGSGPGVCTPCEAGKYSSRVGSPGEESCLRCPSNSQSGVGSGDIDQCA